MDILLWYMEVKRKQLSYRKSHAWSDLWHSVWEAAGWHLAFSILGWDCEFWNNPATSKVNKYFGLIDNALCHQLLLAQRSLNIQFLCRFGSVENPGLISRVGEGNQTCFKAKELRGHGCWLCSFTTSAAILGHVHSSHSWNGAPGTTGCAGGWPLVRVGTDSKAKPCLQSPGKLMIRFKFWKKKLKWDVK